jgi:hypothetical protein
MALALGPRSTRLGGRIATAVTQRHEYIDTRGAATYLAITPNTLACWRSRREGSAFVKVGERSDTGSASSTPGRAGGSATRRPVSERSERSRHARKMQRLR